MRGEFIDLNGERIYYYAAGTRGVGDPIVLIHGFPTSSHVWFDVVPRLPDGHRVIVVDLPGFGRSDPPPGAAGQLASHAIRVALLLHLLRVERACVVGHGAGGAIAQLMALIPERISGLGIIACGLAPFPPVNARLTMTARLARYLPTWLWHAMARREIARGYVDGDRGRRSADIFLRPFGGVGGGRLFAQHFAELRGEDFMTGSVPGRLSIPTAILVGRDDPFVSLESARALQTSISGATLRICDSQGHFLPEEAPSEVAAVIAELLSR
jgi:pimeloyl-ACP methyl ester carboxylesterase